MVHIKNIVENRLAQNRLAGMAYMFNKVSQTLINFGEIYTNTTEAESSFDVCIKQRLYGFWKIMEYFGN